MRGLAKPSARTSRRVRLGAAVGAAGLSACALAPDVIAQESSTWSLPTPSGTPSVQGPVDVQNPVVRSEPARPVPAPQITNPPAPIIAAPPRPTPTSAAPTPTATARPGETPNARQPPAARPAPTPAPSASATPSPTPSAPAPEAETSATEPASAPSSAPLASSTPEAQAPPPTPAEPGTLAAEPEDSTPWWLLAPAAIAVLGGALWLRRRRPEPVDDESEAVSLEAPAAPPAPSPEPVPAAAAVVPLAREPSPSAGTAMAPEPAPAQEPVTDPGSIEIDFEPVSMRLSLVYATLQYRLTLTASQSRGPGQLVGDMISAHGSLSQQVQLAPALEDLPVLKSVPGLEAGKPQVIRGEIQLPLNAVLPVRRGNGSYLVPLVRIAVTAPDAAATRRVFTVGLPGDAGVAPLRFDAGPMMVDALATREIEAGRAAPSGAAGLGAAPAFAARQAG